MREKGLTGRQKRRFRRTTDSKHANPIAPNVLQHDFEPAAANQAWAGDVTSIGSESSLKKAFAEVGRLIGWEKKLTAR